MKVLGVDGAPGGWVVADPSSSTLQHVSSLTELTDAEVIAVDIPLAFPTGAEGRAAEREARQLLGRRASSIFSTPPREVFDTGSYEEACATARERTGKAISRQAWGLREKVLDAAEGIGVGLPLIEVHPETAFTTMGGGPCRAAKTTWEGLRERTLLLKDAGLDPDGFRGNAGSAAPHDVLDAIAAAWVAIRHAKGTSIRLGGEEPPIWT